MRVYAIEAIWSKRDSVLRDPEPDKVEDLKPQIAGIWYDEIVKFVNSYFYGKAFIYGVSRDFAVLYIYREFLRLHYVLGLPFGAAQSGAFVQFKVFMAGKAAGLGWVAVGVFVGILLLGIIFAVQDWLELEEGRFDLPEGAVFLRYHERLWWGGLVARPEERAFDFHACKLLGDMYWDEDRITGDGIGKLDFWHTHGLWEAKEKKVIGWYVYRFGDIKLRYIGNAHSRGWRRYRLEVPEVYDLPYDKPIGWGIREADACRYQKEFRHYFVP